MYGNYDNPTYIAWDMDTIQKLAYLNFHANKSWITDRENEKFNYRFYPSLMYEKYGKSHHFPKPVKIGDEKYWLKDEIDHWFKNDAPRWTHEELMRK